MTRRKISSPTSSLPVQIHYSDLVHSAAREVKPPTCNDCIRLPAWCSPPGLRPVAFSPAVDRVVDDVPANVRTVSSFRVSLDYPTQYDQGH